ncbi:MAG: TolC family protein [Bacteroidota bacterium]
MKQFLLTLTLCTLTAFTSFAQNTLSLEEAINIALQNSYGVKIAKNNESISGNLNTYGNAGFLPQATVDASVGYTSNNTAQRFFSGDEQNGQGVGNTSVRAGLALVWTAFDGYRMFAAKERLELQAQRSQAFTASAMQDLATQIQNVYFTAIRIRQQIDIQEQAIELNVALRDLAANKVKIGTGTSLEVLQTTTRVNADSSLLLNLFDQLRQTKISLNLLMGQAADIEFAVPPEMPKTILPKLTQLTQIAIAQNYNIQLLQYDEQIALAQIKEERAALYPRLDLTAGYNYNFSRAEVGFLLSNRTFGPAVGINATYNLFPGRDIRKDIDNARLFKENVALNRADAERTLRADLALLYQEYAALQNQLDLEQRTLQTGSTNTQLAQQLYRSGRATNFDVREAILAETQIKDRISDVQYRQKLIEVELKSVAGIPLFR